MAPRKPSAPASRNSGRIKKAAVPPPAAASVAPAEAPKKRGRVAKAAAPVQDAQPKKRGRAPKTAVEKTEAAAEPKARVGRGRPKAAAAPNVEDAPAPPKRTAGRPRKQNPVASEEVVAPKRRGRPPKSAVDLDRVAGPARVSKKSTTRAAPTMATPNRINPRVRAKLRTRAPPAEKAPVVEDVKPKKRAGRPAKKETAESKTKDARIKKTPTKPRKRRGLTTLEIPDKYADQVKDFLQQLIDNDAAAAAEVPVEEHGELPEGLAEQELGEETIGVAVAVEQQVYEETKAAGANEDIPGEMETEDQPNENIPGEMETEDQPNEDIPDEVETEDQPNDDDQVMSEINGDVGAGAASPLRYVNGHEKGGVVVEDLGSGSDVDSEDNVSVVREVTILAELEDEFPEDAHAPTTPFGHLAGSGMTHPLLTSTPNIGAGGMLPPDFD